MLRDHRQDADESYALLPDIGRKVRFEGQTEEAEKPCTNIIGSLGTLVFRNGQTAAVQTLLPFPLTVDRVNLKFVFHRIDSVAGEYHAHSPDNYVTRPQKTCAARANAGCPPSRFCLGRHNQKRAGPVQHKNKTCMMNLGKSAIVGALALFWSVAGISQAQAEMGNAPAGASNIYLSVFGGYVYQDAAKVNVVDPNAGGAPGLFVAVKDGGFAGLDLGFMLGPDVSPFGLENARIEGTFSANIWSDETKRGAGGLLLDVAGLGSINSGGAPTTAAQKAEIFDGSGALKGHVGRSAAVDLTGSIEFFVRHSETRSAGGFPMIRGDPFVRNANVESWYAGAMLALQPEFLLGNGLSFAADFGAGFYVVDARGKFSSTLFGNTVSVSDSRTALGFRGRMGGALKAALSDSVTASLFGTVNYWSDAPTAVFPSPAFATAKVGLDGLMEAKFGARVTVALGGN